jgi:hypothetical protein
MNEARDMMLGHLLKEAPVPDHGEAYWDAAREAAAPELERLVRSDPARRRVLQVAVAVASVVVAAVVVLVALPGIRGPSVVTARDMLASMNVTSARSHAVVRLIFTDGLATGDGRTPGPVGPDVTRRLILSTRGDMRYAMAPVTVSSSNATSQVITYDEQRHEARDIATMVGDPHDVLVIERPSWGGGLLDEREPLGSFTALTGSVRFQLAEEDPEEPVTETTFLGRPAWRAVLHEHIGGSENGPDLEWRVTVDKATGLVLESVMGTMVVGHSAQEQLTSVFRVTRFEVNPPLPSGWDSIPEAGHSRIGIYDGGTRFGSPETLARRTPVPVLVPGWLPAGYAASDAATMDAGEPTVSRGDKAKLIYLSRNDPRKYWWRMTAIDTASQQVAVRYRRGFSTFTVTTRPLKKGERPYAKAAPPDAQAATLTRGYLAGLTALVSVDPFLGLGPTLALDSGGYRITVNGDLTRSELVAVAESLEERGD